MENLVLGSEGLVGKYLCNYLEKKGESVVRFDIKRTSEEDVRYAILPLDNVDRVYFLAWDVGGVKYLYRENTQLHQLEWNIAILHNVMPQLEVSQMPFVFTSSQLAEENTVYGVTKKLGEMWTRQIGGCFIRLCNVYGANEETSERSHVVSDFVNQSRDGDIQMLSDGTERRQFLHLEDACDAMYAMRGQWICIKDVADIVQRVTMEAGIRRMI